ncbi:DUF3846 domain-containing protein, partial [Pseudomonas sp. SIMBA_059]
MRVNVGESPEVIEVPSELESFQEIVGGRLECVSLSHGIDLWINEEGLMNGLEINFLVVSMHEGQLVPIHAIAGD